MAKNKGGYVDGYVIPLPKKNIADYRKMAALGAKIWMKHGALDYKECVIEDDKIKGVVPFSKLTKKPGDAIVFAYVLFKSRAHRDKVNAKVMKDPEMSMDENKDKKMPFDVKKMYYSGFKVIAG